MPCICQRTLIFSRWRGRRFSGAQRHGQVLWKPIELYSPGETSNQMKKPGVWNPCLDSSKFLSQNWAVNGRPVQEVPPALQKLYIPLPAWFCQKWDHLKLIELFSHQKSGALRLMRVSHILTHAKLKPLSQYVPRASRSTSTNAPLPLDAASDMPRHALKVLDDHYMIWGKK